MNKLTVHPNLIRVGLLALTLPLVLAGCPGDEPPEEPPVAVPPPVAEHPAPPPDAQMCPPNCTLTVFLPTNPEDPPGVSEQDFRVIGGTEVTIELVDRDMERPEDSAATVLMFERGREAFVNRGGQPVQRVMLGRGAQQFRVRDYADDGPCHPDNGGCKYDVINVGKGERPVLDPHVIIFP